MRKIIPFLPEWLNKGDPIPGDFIGSKIIAFGGLEDQKGGDLVLAIEYETPDGIRKRVDISFTELGMWIEDD